MNPFLIVRVDAGVVLDMIFSTRMGCQSGEALVITIRDSVLDLV